MAGWGGGDANKVHLTAVRTSANLSSAFKWIQALFPLPLNEALTYMILEPFFFRWREYVVVFSKIIKFFSCVKFT